MAQSEPKSEAHPSGWELDYFRTFEDGSGLMLERRAISSTFEEVKLTVQYRPGSVSADLQTFRHMWFLTSSDTPEPPTC